MFFRANVYAFIASFLLLVNGQTSHPVNVGLEGSFFTPAFISAQINDTVVFSFVGDIHTVTQSSFENPCSPLPGGFNSGFVGRGTNGTAPVPTWSLTISNVSAPIWYFCAATRPTSHCTSGMVGVINPPSIAMYDQFLSAAKLVVGTPPPVATVILTGQGAFATLSPSASLVFPSTTLLPITSSTSTSTTPTPTPTSTPSPTQTAGTAGSSTTSHLGAIVGGAIGGVVALACLILVLWLFFKRKQRNPVGPETDEFFRYNPVPMPVPVRRPSEVFVEAKRAETLHHNPSVSSNTNTYSDVAIPTTHFSPVRRTPIPAEVRPPQPHDLRGQAFDGLSSDSLPTTATGPTHQPSNVDIRTLAQEVAAVLYQNPPMPSGHYKDSASQDLRGQQSVTIQNPDPDDLDSAGIPYMNQQPPPNYRAATGPSRPHPI